MFFLFLVLCQPSVCGRCKRVFEEADELFGFGEMCLPMIRLPPPAVYLVSVGISVFADALLVGEIDGSTLCFVSGFLLQVVPMIPFLYLVLVG